MSRVAPPPQQPPPQRQHDSAMSPAGGHPPTPAYVRPAAVPQLNLQPIQPHSALRSSDPAQQHSREAATVSAHVTFVAGTSVPPAQQQQPATRFGLEMLHNSDEPDERHLLMRDSSVQSTGRPAQRFAARPKTIAPMTSIRTDPADPGADDGTDEAEENRIDDDDDDDDADDEEDDTVLDENDEVRPPFVDDHARMVSWEHELALELAAESALPSQCLMVDSQFEVREEFKQRHKGTQFIYAIQLKAFNPDFDDSPAAQALWLKHDEDDLKELRQAAKNKKHFHLVFNAIREVLGGKPDPKTGEQPFGDGTKYLGWMARGKYDPGHAYIQVGASLAQLEELAESVKMPMPGLQDNFHPFDTEEKKDRLRFAHPQARVCPQLVQAFYDWRLDRGIPGDIPTQGEMFRGGCRPDYTIINDHERAKKLQEEQVRFKRQWLRDRIELMIVQGQPHAKLLGEEWTAKNQKNNSSANGGPSTWKVGTGVALVPGGQKNTSTSVRQLASVGEPLPDEDHARMISVHPAKGEGHEQRLLTTTDSTLAADDGGASSSPAATGVADSSSSAAPLLASKGRSGSQPRLNPTLALKKRPKLERGASVRANVVVTGEKGLPVGFVLPECTCNLFVPYQQEELVRLLIERALDNVITQLDKEKSSPGQGLREAKRRKVIKDIFPLHYEVDSDFYRQSRAEVVRQFCSVRNAYVSAFSFLDQSRVFVSWMRDYFGEKIGMYFAFLHFYNNYVLYLAVAGLIPAIWSYVAGNDNVSVVVYCVVIMMWSAFFVKFWNRQQNDYAFEWNMLDYEKDEGEMDSFLRSVSGADGAGGSTYGFYEIEGRWVDMTDFAMEAKKQRGENVLRFVPKNHVDTSGQLPTWITGWYGSQTPHGQLERDQLNAYIWRYCKEFLGWTVITTLIGCVLTAIVSLVILKLFLNRLMATYGQVVAGVANGVSIFVLDALYKRVAIKMTEWENHRTVTQFEEKLTSKCFVFQFVNSYFSLFYIAFVKSGLGSRSVLGYTDTCKDGAGKDTSNCMTELSSALMTIILTRLALSLLMQRFLPKYLTKLTLYRLKVNAQVQDRMQEALNATLKGITGVTDGIAVGLGTNKAREQMRGWMTASPTRAMLAEAEKNKKNAGADLASPSMAVAADAEARILEAHGIYPPGRVEVNLTADAPEIGGELIRPPPRRALSEFISEPISPPIAQTVPVAAVAPTPAENVNASSPPRAPVALSPKKEDSEQQLPPPSPQQKQQPPAPASTPTPPQPPVQQKPTSPAVKPVAASSPIAAVPPPKPEQAPKPVPQQLKPPTSPGTAATPSGKEPTSTSSPSAPPVKKVEPQAPQLSPKPLAQPLAQAPAQPKSQSLSPSPSQSTLQQKPPSPQPQSKPPSPQPQQKLSVPQEQPQAASTPTTGKANPPNPVALKEPILKPIERSASPTAPSTATASTSTGSPSALPAKKVEPHMQPSPKLLAQPLAQTPVPLKSQSLSPSPSQSTLQQKPPSPQPQSASPQQKPASPQPQTKPVQAQSTPPPVKANPTVLPSPIAPKKELALKPIQQQAPASPATLPAATPKASASEPTAASPASVLPNKPTEAQPAQKPLLSESAQSTPQKQAQPQPTPPASAGKTTAASLPGPTTEPTPKKLPALNPIQQPAKPALSPVVAPAKVAAVGSPAAVASASPAKKPEPQTKDPTPQLALQPQPPVQLKAQTLSPSPSQSTLQQKPPSPQPQPKSPSPQPQSKPPSPQPQPLATVQPKKVEEAKQPAADPFDEDDDNDDLPSLASFPSFSSSSPELSQHGDPTQKAMTERSPLRPKDEKDSTDEAPKAGGRNTPSPIPPPPPPPSPPRVAAPPQDRVEMPIRGPPSSSPSHGQPESAVLGGDGGNLGAGSVALGVAPVGDSAQRSPSASDAAALDSLGKSVGLRSAHLSSSAKHSDGGGSAIDAAQRVYDFGNQVGGGLFGVTAKFLSHFNVLDEMDKLSLEYQAIQGKYAINRNVLGTFDDYNELVIGYGYMVMFAAAFPISPAITLLHNVVQNSTHGFKLIKNYQKPKYYGATDIGMFWYLLVFLTAMAVGTNTAIICFTSTQLERYFGDNVSTVERLATAILLEHVFGIALYIVLSNISDFRPSLRVQLAFNEQVKDTETEFAEYAAQKQMRADAKARKDAKAMAALALLQGGDATLAAPLFRMKTTTLKGAAEAQPLLSRTPTTTRPGALRRDAPGGRSAHYHALSPHEQALYEEWRRERLAGKGVSRASSIGSASGGADEKKNSKIVEVKRVPSKSKETTQSAPVVSVAVAPPAPIVQPIAVEPVATPVTVAPSPPAPRPVPARQPPSPVSVTDSFDIDWDGLTLPNTNFTLRRVPVFDSETRQLKMVYTQSKANADVFFPFVVQNLTKLDGLVVSESIPFGKQSFRLVIGKDVDSEAISCTLRYESGPLPHYCAAYLVAKKHGVDQIGLYRTMTHVFTVHSAGFGFPHFASLSELRQLGCYNPKYDALTVGLVIPSNYLAPGNPQLTGHAYAAGGGPLSPRSPPPLYPACEETLIDQPVRGGNGRRTDGRVGDGPLLYEPPPSRLVSVNPAAYATPHHGTSAFPRLISDETAQVPPPEMERRMAREVEEKEAAEEGDDDEERPFMKKLNKVASATGRGRRSQDDSPPTTSRSKEFSAGLAPLTMGLRTPQAANPHSTRQVALSPAEVAQALGHLNVPTPAASSRYSPVRSSPPQRLQPTGNRRQVADSSPLTPPSHQPQQYYQQQHHQGYQDRFAATHQLSSDPRARASSQQSALPLYATQPLHPQGRLAPLRPPQHLAPMAYGRVDPRMPFEGAQPLSPPYSGDPSLQEVRPAATTRQPYPQQQQQHPSYYAPSSHQYWSRRG